MWFYQYVKSTFVASLVLFFALGVGTATVTAFTLSHGSNQQIDDLFVYSSSLRASDGTISGLLWLGHRGEWRHGQSLALAERIWEPEHLTVEPSTFSSGGEPAAPSAKTHGV
jgi:hypothetical protein